MSATAIRGSVAALTVGLALWIGYRVVASFLDDAPERPDTGQTMIEEINARAEEGGGPSGSGLQREVIPEDVARRILQHLSSDLYVYDERVYYRWKAHAEERYDQDEHPDGDWTITTNSTGMRGGREPADEKPDLRVLVAGDSQTEGYCNDDETWPALLEAKLRAAHPGKSIEVLNASCGGYNFYHHLGLLEKYLDLSPDVFVHAVFGGNDFAELLGLLHYFERIPMPANADPSALELWKRETDIPGTFRNQALAQADLFHRHPEEKELAVEASRKITDEILRLCAANGIEYVGVYLPPLAESQPERYPESHLATMELLAITPEQTAVSRRLADGFLGFLEERGVRAVDLLGPLREEKRDLYWHNDHHLNLAGNRAVAAGVFPAVDPLVR